MSPTKANAPCPHCESMRHVAYSKGRRRYRTVVRGSVVARGRECLECGEHFLMLEVPFDTPQGKRLWHETGPEPMDEEGMDAVPRRTGPIPAA